MTATRPVPHPARPAARVSTSGRHRHVARDVVAPPTRRPRRIVSLPWPWLAALTPLAAWVSLFAQVPGTPLPLAWPAGGILAGAMLGLAAPRRRGATLAVGAVGIALAYLAHGIDPSVAGCLAAACAAEAVAVRRLLLVRDASARPALLDDGDVSRMIRAVALGSGVGGVAHVLALWLAGGSGLLLCGVLVWATHAASLMVLLPLFLRTPSFPPIAPRRERATQWVVALGTATLVGLAAEAPPLLFIVMPMFAWLGFRGTLREATWVLVGVAILTSVFTALGIGPVAALQERYDLAPELVAGFLQLFLLDCGLILLPLSVSVAQQRTAAAEAAAGRDTLERLLASATGTAIIATDANGLIVVFNPGAEGMLGYAAQEVLGGLPDRFHPAEELRQRATELGTTPVFTTICGALVRTDQPRRLWTFVRRDGSTGTMLLSVAPLPADGGGPGGFLCTAEDVTERERAQEALVATLQHREAAMARLEELDRIRGEFVATVSHELRTPITSIIGYTEVLQDSEIAEESSYAGKSLERISRNSRRLLSLIEDLLTASQIESSQLVAEKEECDLGGAVTKAVAATSCLASGRDLHLEAVVPPEPIPLVGDPQQLERLTLNLLSNAIKYTPDGGSVSLRLRATDAGAELVIRDTGVGIPVEEQDQLFTRFFRSSTSWDQAIQGTGLGLTIVKAIAELHEGVVGIVSEPGTGTTVTVTLPCLRSPASAAGQP